MPSIEQLGVLRSPIDDTRHRKCKQLQAVILADMIGNALGDVHTPFNAGCESLSPPSQQCGEQGDRHRTMRAEYADIRDGQISSAQADRFMGFADILEEDQCGLFGLEKPLVGRDRYRVCLFNAIQAIAHAGQSHGASPSCVHMGPCCTTRQRQRINGARAGCAGSQDEC